MDSRWIRPPRFRAADEAGEHRQATWLELFFDLVFVVAVAELSSILIADPTLGTLLRVNALFVPLWWLWMDVSYYGDQFDTDDVAYRLALFAGMFLVIVLAHAMEPAIGGDPATFGRAMVGLYVLLFALYVRAYRSAPRVRSVTRYYVAAMAGSAALWAGVGTAPVPYALAFGVGAITLSMVASPVAYWRHPDAPSQLSHMPERFGLFVIIVLGEAVVAVANGVREVALRAPVIALAGAAFALGAGLWWTYFIRSDSSAITQALGGGRRALMRSFVFGYGHLPILAGIGAAGVGAEEAILAATGERAWSDGARWVMAAGVALAVGGMALAHAAAPHALPRAAVAGRVTVAAFALGVGASGLGPVASLAVLAALVTGLAVAETIGLPHPSELPSEAAVPSGADSEAGPTLSD